jgi:hypothetical protein
MKLAICVRSGDLCYEGFHCVIHSRDAADKIHGLGPQELRMLAARDGPFTGCPCIPEPDGLDEEVLWTRPVRSRHATTAAGT